MRAVYREIHKIVPNLLGNKITLSVDVQVDQFFSQKVALMFFNIQGLIENKIDENNEV